MLGEGQIGWQRILGCNVSFRSGPVDLSSGADGDLHFILFSTLTVVGVLKET